LAVGVALAEALDPCADGAAPRLLLKWPNDLWLADADTNAGGQGRKLGGVLIETVNVGGHRVCVVGVGLNVGPQPAGDGGASAPLSHGWACVQEIEPAATPPAVLARVAEPLVRAVLDFERHGFAPLAHRYARRDLLRGRLVSTTRADVPSGVAEGLDEHGALLVRTVPAGELHRVVSGEVSVRPMQPAPDGPARPLPVRPIPA
jgi:BirA family biotin operon repressor/biotin-[acetyl-CoA-carboxylase] ligase